MLAGAKHSAALTDDGVLYVWGQYTPDDLTAAPQAQRLGGRVVRVTAGFDHVVALVADVGPG